MEIILAIVTFLLILILAVCGPHWIVPAAKKLNKHFKLKERLDKFLEDHWWDLPWFQDKRREHAESASINYSVFSTPNTNLMAVHNGVEFGKIQKVDWTVMQGKGPGRRFITGSLVFAALPKSLPTSFDIKIIATDLTGSKGEMSILGVNAVLTDRLYTFSSWEVTPWTAVK